ncbi:hypothetical protein ACWDSD_16350 [Streptomyces spiralis]
MEKLVELGAKVELAGPGARPAVATGRRTQRSRRTYDGSGHPRL